MANKIAPSIAVVLVSTAFLWQSVGLGATGGLFNSRQIVSLGLQRDWACQIKLDRQRAELKYLLYDDKTLFIVSSDAMLHAINAETGGLLWSSSVGDSDAVTLPPAANSRMVAIVNGTTASAFDRITGKLVWQMPCAGIPLGGCALSEAYIYIPLHDGRIAAFNFDFNVQERTTPPKKEPAQSVPGVPRDAFLDKMEESFKAAKEVVLPPPVEKKRVEPLRLNPGSSLPMYLRAFGHIWLQPTICRQQMHFALSRTTSADDYTGTVTYDDFKINPPTSHREQIAWVSDAGSVFFGEIANCSTERFELCRDVRIVPRSYSFDRDGLTSREMIDEVPIAAPPTYYRFLAPRGKEDPRNVPGLVIVGTSSSYIFAIEDGAINTSDSGNNEGEASKPSTKSGSSHFRVRWQFAASGAILERIAVVDDVAYACIARGGMHAIDVISGKEKWFAPDVRSFIAATPTRLYVTSSNQRLCVLDRATGTMLARGDSLEGYVIRYQNMMTDQIFLANSAGLVQCLSELHSAADTADDAEANHQWQTSSRELVERMKYTDVTAADADVRAILDGIAETRAARSKKATPIRPASVSRMSIPLRQTTSLVDDDPFSETTPASPRTTAPQVTSLDDDDPFADSGTGTPPVATPPTATPPTVEPAVEERTYGDSDDPFEAEPVDTPEPVAGFLTLHLRLRVGEADAFAAVVAGVLRDDRSLGTGDHKVRLF